MRSTTTLIPVMLAALFAVSLSPDAEAGWKRRARVAWEAPAAMPAAAYPIAAPVAMGAAPMPVQPASYAAPAQAPTSGDAAGFLAWLNGVRASVGCGPVGWDASLAAGAAQNSAVGFGHAIRCGRRQNAGVGDLGTVCSVWLRSPAHYAALVDPSITRIGLAAVGAVWTFNGD